MLWYVYILEPKIGYFINWTNWRANLFMKENDKPKIKAFGTQCGHEYVIIYKRYCLSWKYLLIMS